MLRHAYLIAAHNNFVVLERLIRLLDDDRNDIYLHVDSKVPDFDVKRFSGLCQHSRLVMMPRRKVYWGDISQVDSVLRMMNAALSTGHYSYLHLLSDSDLPLKSADAIHEFFATNQGREFIAFDDDISAMKREWIAFWYPLNWLLRSPHPFIRGSYLRFREKSVSLQRRLGVDRTRRIGVEVRTGSDWCSITAELGSVIVGNSSTLRRRLRWAFVPSEFFVHTAAWNSPFRSRIYDAQPPGRANLRLIDFERGTGDSPLTWRRDHLEDLINSDLFFARKFNADVDLEVIDGLFAHLHAKPKPSS